MNRIDVLMFVNAQLAKVYLDSRDGVLSVDEIIPRIKECLAFAGVDIPQFVGDVFIEKDGDLHIVLSKDLLDKIRIKL